MSTHAEDWSSVRIGSNAPFADSKAARPFQMEKTESEKEPSHKKYEKSSAKTKQKMMSVSSWSVIVSLSGSLSVWKQRLVLPRLV